MVPALSITNNQMFVRSNQRGYNSDTTVVIVLVAQISKQTPFSFVKTMELITLVLPTKMDQSFSFESMTMVTAQQFDLTVLSELEKTSLSMGWDQT